jgi:hypothetical protein
MAQTPLFQHPERRYFAEISGLRYLRAHWGAGTTSSSDGQYFRVGGRGEHTGQVNARYGHISDRYAPFHTRSSARQFATQTMFSMGCFTTILICESKNTAQVRQGLLTMSLVFATCWDSASRLAFAILPIGGDTSRTKPNSTRVFCLLSAAQSI